MGHRLEEAFAEGHGQVFVVEGVASRFWRNWRWIKDVCRRVGSVVALKGVPVTGYGWRPVIEKICWSKVLNFIW